jgi:hypothetical protein
VTRSGRGTAAEAPERRGLRFGDLTRLLVTWALSSLALMLAASQLGLLHGTVDGVSPGGFSRSFSRTVAEIVKERWQARRQERRRLEPRVTRGWEGADEMHQVLLTMMRRCGQRTERPLPV